MSKSKKIITLKEYKLRSEKDAIQQIIFNSKSKSLIESWITFLHEIENFKK